MPRIHRRANLPLLTCLAKRMVMDGQCNEPSFQICIALNLRTKNLNTKSRAVFLRARQRAVAAGTCPQAGDAHPSVCLARPLAPLHA